MFCPILLKFNGHASNPQNSLIFPSARVMNVQVLSHGFCKFSLQWRPPSSLCCRAETRPCKAMNLSSHLLTPGPASPPTPLNSHVNLQISPKHTTQLVETFFETQRLKTLLQKLRRNEDPMQVLRDEGDWNRIEFWAILRFLKETSRMKEALQVFDLWTKKEKSRINEDNYTKIIQLLGEAGFMEDAAVKFQEMENTHGFFPSIAVYNFIIHGYAMKGEFGDAKRFLDRMIEQDLAPETETYNGLIRAYGNHKLYDDMAKCMKKMESSGYCSPNHLTYNILIREFARAGLLERMERTYRTVLSKHLDLQTSTCVAMLEAYANLGLLEKMEKAYRRILNSKTLPREGLIRKMAEVFIENYRFSRLEELGLDVASLNGEKTNLVWSLLLLSQAGILSRRGMESVVEEMKAEKVWPNITFVNMISMAYFKLGDFRRLDRFLCGFGVKPDIVTVGIVIDVYLTGFDGVKALEVWRRKGFLEEAAEMRTDPLVLTAFGKGCFLRTSEVLFASLHSKAMKKKVWTYRDLIDLVFNQNARGLPSLIAHFEGRGRV